MAKLIETLVANLQSLDTEQLDPEMVMECVRATFNNHYEWKDEVIER